ncbi:MAG: hypothetical protein A2X36_02620 [Elusimicrobia bacterium GWA2_69_24]|nr:MAG: hypothetical protein A2X36_02620 [Elusimicrobia bacterium GWA2_69_24]
MARKGKKAGRAVQKTDARWGRCVDGSVSCGERLERSRRAMKVVMGCMRAVATARDPRKLLTQICGIATKAGGYRLAWVGQARADKARSIVPVAQAGVSEGYLEGLKLTWADTPRGRGPTGTAVRTGRPSCARDILKDPRFKPWRKAARERGYASSLSLPFDAGETLTSTLNVYATEPGAFDAEEIRLLADFADILSFGLASLRDRCDAADMQSALADSERKYRALFANAMDAIFIADAKTGNLIDANAAAVRLIGRSMDELIGMHQSELHPPELADHYRGVFRRHAQAPASEALQIEVLRKDGTRVPVIIAANTTTIGGRKVVQGVFKDISELKRSIDALERSEAELWTVFETLPFDVFVLGKDGRYRMQNTACRRNWGDVVGRRPEDVAPDARVLERWVANNRRAFAGERVFGEASFDTKAGKCHVQNIMAPILKDGVVDGVLGVNIDVTELRRTADVLRESEEKFRALAEESPNMIFINKGGRVVYANKRCSEIMGYSRDEFLASGFDFLALIAPEHKERIRQSFVTHMRGEDVPAYEYALLTRSGTRLETIITTNLIDFEGERAILGIVTDVSERNAAFRRIEALLIKEKRLRKAAEDANRAKNNFLALLSHELRTPMTAIMGWTWLLRSKPMSSQESQDALETIERNMKAQAQIIEDLLDFSRIVAGKMRMEVRDAELGPLVEASLDVVRPSAQAHGIRLEMQEEDAGIRIRGDAERIQQALWNLLTNSVKFTEKGGWVRVTLRRAGEHAEIAIRDSGAGIAKDYLTHVFEPFGQGEDTLTRDHGGLGLGLAIVRHIADLHGGTVQALSEGPGCGSEFRLSLPLAGPGPEESPERAETEERKRHPFQAFNEPVEKLDGMHVLVVDDDLDTLHMLRVTLEHCGARVTTAGAAAEAFEKFRAARPDVIVCDIAMPGEDGYGFIGRIRALSPEDGGDVPAAALTALTRVEDRTRALRSGFQMYLPKPVEPSELTAVIRTLREERRRR